MTIIYYFSSHCDAVFAVCLLISKIHTVLIWANADSFNIWSWSVRYWYSLSKSKDPSASISPQSCQFCLHACWGPGLILEGFVWFVVLICMSVCEKMEDSCQCRGICLCHLLPSSIPVSILPPFVSFPLPLPLSSPSLCLFSILSHWTLHKASKKWIILLSQPLKRRFNQK